MASDDEDDRYDPLDDDDLNSCSEDEDSSNGNTSCSYTILSLSDIQQRQEELINLVSTTLSITPSSSTVLLRHHNWDLDTTHEGWFTDESRARAAAGLPEPNLHQTLTLTLTCKICLDSHDDLIPAPCGHSYCRTCWGTYISTSINDGPGCLLLRCPAPSCKAAIGRDMVDTLLADDDGARARYMHYLTRSYVEDRKQRGIKWCPAPGCELAVAGGGAAGYVVCGCSYTFCWNCTEEYHRPVKCDLVAKWLAKNISEAQNSTWLLANSKPCPECKRPIEKDDGCMHMVCAACNHEFCWLCLGPWTEHGENSGGFYACNIYNSAKEEGKYTIVEKEREEAKKSIKRYTHFYERWLSNHLARNKAMDDLKNLQESKLDVLACTLGQTNGQLRFIPEAYMQVIECRRVLKWAYAYGYYLTEGVRSKRLFFEHLQGEGEAALERLHQCAEKDLESFVIR